MTLPDDPDIKAAVEAMVARYDGSLHPDLVRRRMAKDLASALPHLERYFRKQFEKQEAAVKRMLSE